MQDGLGPCSVLLSLLDGLGSDLELHLADVAKSAKVSLISSQLGTEQSKHLYLFGQ